MVKLLERRLSARQLLQLWSWQSVSGSVALVILIAVVITSLRDSIALMFIFRWVRSHKGGLPIPKLDDLDALPTYLMNVWHADTCGYIMIHTIHWWNKHNDIMGLNYQPQLVIAGLRPGAMLDFIGAFGSASWILHGIFAMIFNTKKG